MTLHTFLSLLAAGVSGVSTFILLRRQLGSDCLP